LSNVSFIIARSSRFKEYILLSLILFAQFYFRSIDMWFSERIITEMSCSFYMLNFNTIERNLSITFCVSYTMISFRILISSFSLLNWIISSRFWSFSIMSSCDDCFMYLVDILFVLKISPDLESRRRSIENPLELRIRRRQLLIRAVLSRSESNLSSSIRWVYSDVFWVRSSSIWISRYVRVRMSNRNHRHACRICSSLRAMLSMHRDSTQIKNLYLKKAFFL
jgi:hypothetical protein